MKSTASSLSAPSARLAIQIHRARTLLTRYWWVVVAATALCVLLQLIRCTQIPVRYISTSRMMVNGHIAIPQGDVYSEELTNFYGTQTALMQSPDTLAKAQEQVLLDHPGIEVDPKPLVEAVQEARTSIFDLQVTAGNKEYARALLDAVMNTYLDLKRGRKTETTNETVSAITAQIAKLDTDIHDDEQQLLNFQKQNDVVFIEEQSTSAGDYLVGLNNEAARLTKQHNLLALENAKGDVDEGQTSSENSAPGASAPGDSSGTTFQMEEERIGKLQILQAGLARYLRPKHPKMVALADSIAQEKAFLQTLKSRTLAERMQLQGNLELQLQNLDQQIAAWNKKSLDLTQRLATYEQLKSKVTREQALYNQLSSSIQNVNVDKSIDQEDVSRMEPASPAVPIGPNYLEEALFGVVFGFLLGGAVIYFLNRLDDKIDSPLELESTFSHPVIGQIPRADLDPATRSLPRLGEDDPRHVLAESYRNIRSSLLYQFSTDKPARSILISSAIPGEGKSTLAANLAITFAFAGTRVLLVDADLRRGVLHKIFGFPEGPGLSDYLLQKLNWREAVHKTETAHLDVLTRGKVPRQPGELLLSPLTELLLRESAADYDLVLWDSAPLLAADDAANLCFKTDCVLVLARARYSSIHSLGSALDILAKRGASVRGLVLNALEYNQPGYHDYYRYKEYYATTAADESGH